MKNLDFNTFGETKRNYKSNTPIYLLNENHDNKSSHVVVFDGEDILQKVSAKIATRRSKLTFDESEMTITGVYLKPRKRIFTEENTNTTTWKVVCVGNKRETTHLKAGLLFQLRRLN